MEGVKPSPDLVFPYALPSFSQVLMKTESTSLVTFIITETNEVVLYMILSSICFF